MSDVPPASAKSIAVASAGAVGVGGGIGVGLTALPDLQPFVDTLAANMGAAGIILFLICGVFTGGLVWLFRYHIVSLGAASAKWLEAVLASASATDHSARAISDNTAVIRELRNAVLQVAQQVEDSADRADERHHLLHDRLVDIAHRMDLLDRQGRRHEDL